MTKGTPPPVSWAFAALAVICILILTFGEFQ